jgi:hypothetical protein
VTAGSEARLTGRKASGGLNTVVAAEDALLLMLASVLEAIVGVIVRVPLPVIVMVPVDTIVTVKIPVLKLVDTDSTA